MLALRIATSTKVELSLINVFHTIEVVVTDFSKWLHTARLP